MACSTCGGKKVITTQQQQQALKASGDMIILEYIGVATQKQRLRSKVKPQDTYVFSGSQRKFLAYRGDVEWLTAMSNRFRVSSQPVASTNTIPDDAPVLMSAAKPILTDLPIDVLTIDPITLGLLKRKFSTVNEVKNAGKAEWMTIKGIGAARADDIQAALDALKK